MIPFFRRIRNLPAGKAGKMANNPFCSFFLAQKKEPNLPAGRQEKELTLHKAVSWNHLLHLDIQNSNSFSNLSSYI